MRRAPGRRGRRGHCATQAAWEETVAAPAVTWDLTNMGDHPSVGQRIRRPPGPELAPWATAAPPARRTNPKGPAPRCARLPLARPRRRTCSAKATDTPQQLLGAAARAKPLSACWWAPGSPSAPPCDSWCHRSKNLRPCPRQPEMRDCVETDRVPKLRPAPPRPPCRALSRTPGRTPQRHPRKPHERNAHHQPPARRRRGHGRAQAWTPCFAPQPPRHPLPPTPRLTLAPPQRDGRRRRRQRRRPALRRCLR